MPSPEDDATTTNISVEEQFSVSTVYYAGPAEEISTAAKALIGRSTTLTEALKAASINVGRKPVETTDVAAIKEVESRVTGGDIENADGVTAMANEAVVRNQKTKRKDEMTNLSDVMAEIDIKMRKDRSVTSEDAEAVVQAELTHSNHIIPGGIAESVTAACKLNRNPSSI